MDEVKNKTILPADTYTVINKTVINDSDRRLVSMLYQPIIGYAAVSLYFTLLDDLDKSELMSYDLTHHHLMATMQLKLEDIVVARQKLEASGLLKTYFKSGNINQYVYLIYSPMSAHEFLTHPILNVVLYNNLGKNEYERIVNYFKVPYINLRDYEDITSSFDQVFTSARGSVLEATNEVRKREIGRPLLEREIDFNMLISSIPNSMVHERCFSKEAKELINALSFTYQLDTLAMQGLVRDSLNEKGFIDKNLLRKNCREYYQFEHAGDLPTVIYNKQPEFLKKPEGDHSKWAKMVYAFENLTPYQFLKAKYKGAEPTDRDKRLIENLLIDQKLNPGVVNVLISYVLKINHEQLKKSYVETIAGQWKRLNIETVEEAMKVAEKEHKKLKKIANKSQVKSVSKTKKETSLPAWFDKNLENEETTPEEEEELNKILQELV